MLTPLVKEEGITNSEKYLSTLAEKTFIGLWSYPNVYTDEGFSKNKIGKELCDLLVVFENKVIIFSDKDIKFNEDVDVKIAWKRWYTRSIVKSAKQLYGAESWIRCYPDKVYLDKQCSIPFPIDICSEQLELHLIAVTKNSYNAAKKFYDKKCTGSSGTLMQIFSLSANDYYEFPFTIGDIDPSKTFVHVFDEVTLDLILSELKTIYDFTDYLKEKVTAIRTRHLLSVCGEEDLLAYYLSSLRFDRQTSLYIPELQSNQIGFSIAENEWQHYKSSVHYHILSAYRASSSYWDFIVSNLSACILDANVGFGAEFDIKTHETALRYLASESMISRSKLSEALVEKIKSVPSNVRSARLVFSPLYSDRLYVFLVYPLSNLSDNNEYRLERVHVMQAYCLVAKYLNPNAKHIIVVATEPNGSSVRSEDILSTSYSEPLTYVEKQQAKIIMHEQKILNTVVDNSSFDSGKNRSAFKCTIRRNELCTCGSGIKYKKCCMK